MPLDHETPIAYPKLRKRPDIRRPTAARGVESNTSTEVEILLKNLDILRGDGYIVRSIGKSAQHAVKSPVTS